MADRQEPDDLLLSHEERTFALNVLSEHYADGRLDVEEFYDRSGTIASARALSAIREPFAGLPGGVPLEIADGRIRRSQELATQPDNSGSAALEKPVDAEAELASLRRRGSLVESIDWIIIGTTLVTFLVLQFLVDWDYAWLVWPSLILTLSIPRMLFDFSDDDEEIYDELKESDAESRKKRLKQAAKRLRELDDGKGGGAA